MFLLSRNAFANASHSVSSSVDYYYYYYYLCKLGSVNAHRRLRPRGWSISREKRAQSRRYKSRAGKSRTSFLFFARETGTSSFVSIRQCLLKKIKKNKKNQHSTRTRRSRRLPLVHNHRIFALLVFLIIFQRRNVHGTTIELIID